MKKQKEKVPKSISELLKIKSNIFPNVKRAWLGLPKTINGMKPKERGRQ